MLGVRRDERHRGIAEPRTQAIDERHGRGGVVAGEQSEVAAGERSRRRGRERDRLDRRRQHDARQPLAQHADEMRGLARRRREREAGRRGGHAGGDADVTLVREGERHLGDAESAACEPSRELEDEPVYRERERIDIGDRRRQVELSRVARRRHERRPQLGSETAHAIEEGDEILARTPRQCGARQRERLAEGLDAGGFEHGDGGRIGFGEGERQRAERVEPRSGGSGRRYPRFRCRPGEQQGGGGRRRQCQPRVVAQVARAVRKPRRQGRQPAEEPQAAADLDEHRGGRREGDDRRELCRPRRHGFERGGLGLRGALAQHEVGRERERRRDELPGAHSGIARGGVRADDARRASAGGHRERLRGVSGRVPPREDVERQRRQEDACPEHGEARRKSAHRAEGSPRGSPQMAASESPSRASSAARRCASFAQKNSSSCGGLTGVPASIACAWPR